MGSATFWPFGNYTEDDIEVKPVATMRVPLGMLVRVTGIERIVASLVAGFERVPDVLFNLVVRDGRIWRGDRDRRSGTRSRG